MLQLRSVISIYIHKDVTSNGCINSKCKNCQNTPSYEYLILFWFERKILFHLQEIF